MDVSIAIRKREYFARKMECHRLKKLSMSFFALTFLQHEMIVRTSEVSAASVAKSRSIFAVGYQQIIYRNI